jgi:hypothetical protein
MTHFDRFERTLDRLGTTLLLSMGLLLGTATATLGLPVWV